LDIAGADDRTDMMAQESLYGSIDCTEQSLVAYTDQRGTMIMTGDGEADWVEQENALSKLVGARLTSVQFVLDYLILGFDERGALTTLIWPEICHENKHASFGMVGYRDDLCSLIEKTVKSATMEQDETIRIHFENRAEIRIPLRSYQGRGERAILTGPKHFLLVL
jgi:hypothetical protein